MKLNRGDVSLQSSLVVLNFYTDSAGKADVRTIMLFIRTIDYTAVQCSMVETNLFLIILLVLTAVLLSMLIFRLLFL